MDCLKKIVAWPDDIEWEDCRLTLITLYLPQTFERTVTNWFLQEQLPPIDNISSVKLELIGERNKDILCPHMRSGPGANGECTLVNLGERLEPSSLDTLHLHQKLSPGQQFSMIAGTLRRYTKHIDNKFVRQAMV